MANLSFPSMSCRLDRPPRPGFHGFRLMESWEADGR